jgi:hypothetical protein
MTPEGRPQNIEDEAKLLVRKLLASANDLDRMDGIVVDTILHFYDEDETEIAVLKGKVADRIACSDCGGLFLPGKLYPTTPDPQSAPVCYGCGPLKAKLARVAKVVEAAEALRVAVTFGPKQNLNEGCNPGYKAYVPLQFVEDLDAALAAAQKGPLLTEGTRWLVVPRAEARLRFLLWAMHPCVGKYGDDGELQCPCGCDFRRDSVDEIERKTVQMNLRKLAAARGDASPFYSQTIIEIDEDGHVSQKPMPQGDASPEPSERDVCEHGRYWQENCAQCQRGDASPEWQCPNHCGHSREDHICNGTRAEAVECKRGCHAHDGSDGPCDCTHKETEPEVKKRCPKAAWDGWDPGVPKPEVKP